MDSSIYSEITNGILYHGLLIFHQQSNLYLVLKSVSVIEKWRRRRKTSPILCQIFCGPRLITWYSWRLRCKTDVLMFFPQDLTIHKTWQKGFDLFAMCVKQKWKTFANEKHTTHAGRNRSLALYEKTMLKQNKSRTTNSIWQLARQTS